MGQRNSRKRLANKMAYKIKQEKSKKKISINPFSEEEVFKKEEEAFDKEMLMSEDGI